MAEKYERNLIRRVRDISVIILCWLLIVFLVIFIRNALQPAGRAIERANSLDIGKLNKSLDNLERVTKNLADLTEPVPIREQINVSATHLANFTDNLTSISARMDQTVASFKGVANNLKAATRPEQIDARLYKPLSRDLRDLADLINELRLTVARLSLFQDQINASLAPTLARISQSADKISSSVLLLSAHYARVGNNLAQFTNPKNLNSILSLREAARQINMPLSKSAAEVERTRQIVQLGMLLDDEMRKEGYNVDLANKNISVDEFNSFQRVRIDVISLIDERGRHLQARWAKLQQDNLKSGYKAEEFMRWSYSITALRRLAKEQISLSEEMEHVMTRLPEIDNIGDTITPAMVDAFRNDPVLKDIKSFIVIHKAYPHVRIIDTPLAMPLKIPLEQLNIIRKEIPLPGSKN